jgi:hypothetical protein
MFSSNFLHSVYFNQSKLGTIRFCHRRDRLNKLGIQFLIVKKNHGNVIMRNKNNVVLIEE